MQETLTTSFGQDECEKKAVLLKQSPILVYLGRVWNRSDNAGNLLEVRFYCCLIHAKLPVKLDDRKLKSAEVEFLY